MIWLHVTGVAGGLMPAAWVTDLPEPQKLGVGPERGAHELAVPGARFDGAGQRARGELLRLGVAVRPEEAGLGELGDERRVEAHQVDGGVLGRQPPDQLLPLAGGVVREHRRLDAVGAVRRRRALRGQLGLPAVVGVDVPVQGGDARVAPPPHAAVTEASRAKASCHVALPSVEHAVPPLEADPRRPLLGVSGAVPMLLPTSDSSHFRGVEDHLFLRPESQDRVEVGPDGGGVVDLVAGGLGEVVAVLEELVEQLGGSRRPRSSGGISATIGS